MAANRWSFTADQLANTPSGKWGIDTEKESNYRQQAASLIQDMGQRLQVYPLSTEWLYCDAVNNGITQVGEQGHGYSAKCRTRKWETAFANRIVLGIC